MDIERATATRQFIENSDSISVLAMVFYSMRADDVDKQNIVSMKDISDPSTDFPSWVKLLDLQKYD